MLSFFNKAEGISFFSVLQIRRKGELVMSDRLVDEVDDAVSMTLVGLIIFSFKRDE